MHIDELHDLYSFLQLRPAWDELCAAAGVTSFFLSHAWFRCCWLGKREEERPFVVVVREGSKVVGLAPFFAQRSKWRIFPVRTAVSMQNQDSPFSDIILGPDRAGAILGTILEHLGRSPQSQIVAFNTIPRSSPMQALLANSSAGVPLVRTTGGRSPVLRLEGDWNGFWTAQSQRFKKTVRNIANRVERLGRVTVEELSATATAEECMQVFASVAARSWKAQLPVSLGRDSGIARFFAGLTSELHACGRLSLWVLRVDGMPIATEYHVHDGETVYALRSDFDDHYREASPGAYLNDQIVRAYFEANVRTYDMGPGDNEYKLRWANGARDFDDFSFFSRRPYPLTVYSFEQHAVPRLRRARDWWRSGATVATPGETASHS